MALALAAIAAISAGYTIYSAEHQKAQAKKARNSAHRPNYEIPQATTDFVNKSAFEAGKYGIPGQSQVEAQLARTEAGTRRSITESGLSPLAMMQAYTSAQQNTNLSNEKLSMEAERYKASALNTHYSALNALSREQGSKFNYDKIQPYEDQMATASALTNAGIRNEEAGVHDALQSTSNLMMMNKMGYFDGNGSGGSQGIPPQKTAGYSNVYPHGLNTPSPYENMGQYDLGALKAQYEGIYGPITNEELMYYLNYNLPT